MVAPRLSRYLGLQFFQEAADFIGVAELKLRARQRPPANPDRDPVRQSGERRLVGGVVSGVERQHGAPKAAHLPPNRRPLVARGARQNLPRLFALHYADTAIEAGERGS